MIPVMMPVKSALPWGSATPGVIISLIEESVHRSVVMLTAAANMFFWHHRLLSIPPFLHHNIFWDLPSDECVSQHVHASVTLSRFLDPVLAVSRLCVALVPALDI